MTRYFGTDGVRGIANTELTCEMAYTLGKAAVELLGKTLVIGRDTRRSGTMLEAALVAGITSAGGDALLAGVTPTPAVALLTRQLDAQGGVVISASHNAPEYNGIKFFDAQGFKLPRDLEDKFEARLQAKQGKHGDGSRVSSPEQAPTGSGTPTGPTTPTGPAVGIARPIEDANERYVAHAVEIVRAQGIDFSGLTIAVDCGHGASFYTTPEALRRLGAEVIAINTSFDGNDINVGCGSTHLEQIKAAVVQFGADAGMAHDGDADRLLAVDAQGNELDGDFIEAICALDLASQGKLPHNTVVSTIVCNLGFVTAMREHNIEVVQTDVGDSNVLAAMREGGYVVGGEQSGHMILLDHNSTGDGLITVLQLLTAMKRNDKTLAELAQTMTRYPQVTINVKVADKTGFHVSTLIQQAITAAGARLGADGRVLLRPSGTEPLIRVMVEAKDEQTAHTEAEQLAAIVERELG
jgi:phosphoglucosamine mutase